MKNIKCLIVLVLMASILFSCKKTNSEENNIVTNINDVTVKNGVVTFNSFSSYFEAVENKNDAQAALFSKIESQNFVALKSKTGIANFSNNTVSNLSQLINSFDSSLYTDYLLGVLNTDKIFNLNGFLIKVDMDNNFCSFIDLITNPNGYQDLNTNNFANSNIHVFLNEDEPVLTVLEAIRNNQITWESYQIELSRKTNNPGGLCVKAGAAGERKSQSLGYIPPYSNFGAGFIGSNVAYIKNFLSFTLKWDSRIYKGGSTPPPSICNRNVSFRVNCVYEFVGACKGSGTASYWVDNRSQECIAFSGTVYQAGSPLIVRKIKLYTMAKTGAYSDNTFDYPYNNYTFGYSPISIGY
jgi:hypothetical protein